jgi:hypothetical protein
VVRGPREMLAAASRAVRGVGAGCAFVAGHRATLGAVARARPRRPRRPDPSREASRRSLSARACGAAAGSACSQPLASSFTPSVPYARPVTSRAGLPPGT